MIRIGFWGLHNIIIAKYTSNPNLILKAPILVVVQGAGAQG